MPLKRSSTRMFFLTREKGSFCRLPFFPGWDFAGSGGRGGFEVGSGGRGGLVDLDGLGEDLPTVSEESSGSADLACFLAFLAFFLATAAEAVFESSSESEEDEGVSMGVSESESDLGRGVLAACFACLVVLEPASLSESESESDESEDEPEELDGGRGTAAAFSASSSESELDSELESEPELESESELLSELLSLEESLSELSFFILAFFGRGFSSSELESLSDDESLSLLESDAGAFLFKLFPGPEAGAGASFMSSSLESLSLPLLLLLSELESLELDESELESLELESELDESELEELELESRLEELDVDAAFFAFGFTSIFLVPLVKSSHVLKRVTRDGRCAPESTAVHPFLARAFLNSA